jgi:hypothetical protein
LVVANNSKWVTDNIGPFFANVIAGITSTLLVVATPRVMEWLRGEK